jgi:GH15 family glucan-1,4-alpha-glucosidase
VGRPVVLSNNQLFVGLDEYGLVHDFYYPYVGLENLTTARTSHHKIGLWVDGQFSWTDDGSWNIQLGYEPGTLVSKLQLTSPRLRVTLHLKDFVDISNNAFVRNITVTNNSTKQRDVRIFMHQVFQLSQDGRGDTALYVPDGHYILDYKGRYCLLIAGKFSDGKSFDQYAAGSFGLEGKSGTFVDAEDGVLSGNPVENNGVDSVIRFRKQLGPAQATTIDYWVIAGDSQPDIERVHRQYTSSPMVETLESTRMYWRNWLKGGDVELPISHLTDLTRSLLTIKAHADERGSLLASGDSSIFNYGHDYYCYCWPRDAAYALWPLIRLGHYDEAKKYFEFARDTMHKDGYMLHKYQPDRAIGSTWHPLVHGRSRELAIQEDETAILLFIIGEYFEISQDLLTIENLYSSVIEPAANFLERFIDEASGLPHASYDLWEEKFLTTTYTVCTVIGGLRAAAKLAETVEHPDDASRWLTVAKNIEANLNKLLHPDGYFIKGFLLQPDGTTIADTTVDISNLYGPFMFAGLPLDDPRLIATTQQVEQKLVNTTPSGGVLRYEHDAYFLSEKQYMGNPWAICSLWMAQFLHSTGQRKKALDLLEWVLEREGPAGLLSEQYDAASGLPTSVTPLVWSHAELVNTLLDLYK